MASNFTVCSVHTVTTCAGNARFWFLRTGQNERACCIHVIRCIAIFPMEWVEMDQVYGILSGTYDFYIFTCFGGKGGRLRQSAFELSIDNLYSN